MSDPFNSGQIASETNGIPVKIVESDATINLTGDVVVDTLGALNDAAVTDPAASSATVPALLRGLQAKVGEVAASPTANTLLDRLKTIAANLGTVVLAASSAAIGTVRLTPAAASALSETKVDIASATTTELISASSGQTGRLQRIMLVAAAAVNVTFKDGSTALTGAIALAAGVPFVLDYSGEPWFTTSANSALNLVTDGGAQVSGRAYWTKS